jgi:hypothetical protein
VNRRPSAHRSPVTPETILREFGPDIVALTNELRELVRDTVPDVKEFGFTGWRSIAFRHPIAGYVCGAFPFEKEVRLVFEQGVHLPDPTGILEGTTKQIRHVTLRPGAPVPEEPLRDLMLEAVAYGESRALTRKTNRRS